MTARIYQFPGALARQLQASIALAPQARRLDISVVEMRDRIRAAAEERRRVEANKAKADTCAKCGVVIGASENVIADRRNGYVWHARCKRGV